MTLWFVTPAFRRYELSAVCFDQRLRVMAELEREGIAARCVVIADDENLDLARERGFEIVEQDNEWLGRRFNDGIEYAFRHGASRVIPIGSDSWIDPAYFLPMAPRHRAMTSGLYCVVESARLGEINVRDIKGAGPYVLDRSLMRMTHYRPAKDEITHGVDSSTIAGIGLGRIRWTWRDLHPFQYVGFRGTPHISSYDGLMSKWGVREHDDPWAILARHYPLDLVERAKIIMSEPALVAA